MLGAEGGDLVGALVLDACTDEAPERVLRLVSKVLEPQINKQCLLRPSKPRQLLGAEADGTSAG